MTDLYQGLPFPRRIIAIVTTLIGSLMLMIDTSIASVVLPTIAKEMHLPSSSVVIVVTIYQLILAMTVMSMAALGDRFGHRRLYQAGFILHMVGAALSFFADGLFLLVATRALQALGAAAASSMTVALLREIYPAQRLGAGLGVNTIANATGTSLGPVLGGFMLAVGNWHWVFAAIVPFSLVVLAMSRTLPEPRPRSHAFDTKGAVLCALTFGLVIAGLEGLIHSDHSALALATVLSGVVLAVFFVRHEMRESDPVLPVDLLAMPPIAFSTIACFTATLAGIVLMLFMPFRLQNGYGFGPAELGGLLSMYAVGSLCTAPAAGLLADRVSVSLLSIVAMIVATIALGCVAFLPENPTHFEIGWRIWLCGVGFGIFSSPNARLIIASAPPQRTASAGSIFSTTRMLSQAVGATVLAALLAFGLGDGQIPLFVAMALTTLAGAISVLSYRYSLARKATG
ncbi:MAG: MFS transporter [Spongiibacteraceae bacterium]